MLLNFLNTRTNFDRIMIFEEYVKVEEGKRFLKVGKLKDNRDASLTEGDKDEDKYEDEVDMSGTKDDSKQRIILVELLTGDTQKYSKAELFVWEAYGKGVVDLIADPSKLELLQQEYDKKKEELKSQVKDTILAKYGGEGHFQVPPKSLLLAQTETTLNILEVKNY